MTRLNLALAIVRLLQRGSVLVLADPQENVLESCYRDTDVQNAQVLLLFFQALEQLRKLAALLGGQDKADLGVDVRVELGIGYHILDEVNQFVRGVLGALHERKALVTTTSLGCLEEEQVL